MKNAIKYYYNLDIKDIHQNTKNYKFKIRGTKYILSNCIKKYEEIIELYNLQIYLKTIGFYCHEIILNKDNEIVTIINNQPYILLKVKMENRRINISDIKIISNITITSTKFTKIKRDNWYNLWTKKIDYIEYQISQFRKKYPLIRESIDYYIGIVENCIMILSELKNQNKTTLAHDRMSNNTMTDDFYNPLNFILDSRTRDIGEYIKSTQTKNINESKYIREYSNEQNLTLNEIKELFVRIIYPSNYLDTCEKILDKKAQEEELIKIISNSKNYEKYIKKIYKIIKELIPMPEIEWLNS